MSAPRTIPPAAVLWLITPGAVAVTALAGISAPRPLRFNLPLLAHTSGLLAGYGVTVMVALMSRAPALERGVGADRLARWHGKGGRAIVSLILIHGVAATAAWATVQGTLAGLPLVQAAWSLLYTFSFGLILRYRVLAPLTQLWRHRLRVDHVVDEGAGVVSIILRGRHLNELNAGTRSVRCHDEGAAPVPGSPPDRLPSCQEGCAIPSGNEGVVSSSAPRPAALPSARPVYRGVSAPGLPIRDPLVGWEVV